MKKIVSLLLINIMLACTVLCAPVTVYAYEGDIEIVDDLYACGDFSVFNGTKLRSEQWMDEAASELRDAMAMRKSKCEIRLSISAQQASGFSDMLEDIFAQAVSPERSASTIDGDYIKWQISACSARYIYNPEERAYTIIYSLGYYDTLDEEIQLNNLIRSYLASLDLSSMTDYEALKAFHDYILAVCEYNYYDIENDYNYSAYGALCLGKAVCQGYALAFYRLCKEAGFDVCFVCSDPNRGCHAWNLVRIGDAYYYVDCTWDDEESVDDDYFFLVDYETLQSMDSFSGEHKIYEEVYNNGYFNTHYRQYISSVPYDSTSCSISNCTIRVNSANCYDVDIRYNGAPLTIGTDYTLSTSSDSFVIINGAGSFAGTASTKCLSVYNTAVAVAENVVYNKNSTLPQVYINGLAQGSDFAVLGDRYYGVGQATCAVAGVGAYRGVYYSSYNIQSADISSVPISLSFTSVYYDGTQRVPEVYVQGLDYNVDYYIACNPPAQDGKGYVTVTGIGNYTSSVTLSYDVVKRSVADLDISLDKTQFEYNGYEKKPKVIISGLVEGQDYTVSYANNIKPGTASVIVNGINIYSGSATLSFTISPAATTKSSSTSSKKPSKTKITKIKTAKKKITVKWKKLSAVSGYQVQYSVNKSFKKPKTITVKSSKATGCKTGALKKGKKYYFRIRAYKTVKGKKVYGAWSAKKSITCK